MHTEIWKIYFLDVVWPFFFFFFSYGYIIRVVKATNYQIIKFLSV